MSGNRELANGAQAPRGLGTVSAEAEDRSDTDAHPRPRPAHSLGALGGGVSSPLRWGGGQVHFHISGGGILMVKIRQPEDMENISNRTKKGARVCLLSRKG